jgi:hypothetical protein
MIYKTVTVIWESKHSYDIFAKTANAASIFSEHARTVNKWHQGYHNDLKNVQHVFVLPYYF